MPRTENPVKVKQYKRKKKGKAALKPVMGHPKLELDWDKINDMAKCFMTSRQICRALNISDATINRHCREKFGMTPAEYLEKWSYGTDYLLMNKALNIIRSGEDKDNKMLMEFLKWRFKMNKIQIDATMESTIKIESDITLQIQQVIEKGGMEGLKGIIDAIAKP